MSSLQHQLETLYYVALVQNPKTAAFKKRSYDTIERVWQRIRYSEHPTETEEFGRLLKSQKEKLESFLKTGVIPVAQLGEKDKYVVALRTLMSIYGVGITKANKLLEGGILSISSLREEANKNPKLLTKAQKLGLEWYEDLHTRIPRGEIDGLRTWLVANVPNTLTWRIVGSYRRGAKTSGDVDILVSGEGRQELIKQMTKSQIIRHTLASGSKKFMGMAVLPSGSKMRHIDIIETTREEFPFTSLYFTGSAEWNIKMRHRANECGLRLNEHAYTHIKTGIPVSPQEYEAKLGKPYPETEQEVCAYIGWDYTEPSNRI